MSDVKATTPAKPVLSTKEQIDALTLDMLQVSKDSASEQVMSEPGERAKYIMRLLDMHIHLVELYKQFCGEIARGMWVVMHHGEPQVIIAGVPEGQEGMKIVQNYCRVMQADYARQLQEQNRHAGQINSLRAIASGLKFGATQPPVVACERVKISGQYKDACKALDIKE